MATIWEFNGEATSSIHQLAEMQVTEIEGPGELSSMREAILRIGRALRVFQEKPESTEMREVAETQRDSALSAELEQPL